MTIYFKCNFSNYFNERGTYAYETYFGSKWEGGFKTLPGEVILC